MTIEIDHGLPKSKFFLIAQPVKTFQEPKVSKDDTKNIVVLKDPETGNILGKAEIWGVCTANEHDFMHMEIFSRMAYGCSPAYLLKELLKRYPDLEKEFVVEYWLLKKI